MLSVDKKSPYYALKSVIKRYQGKGTVIAKAKSGRFIRTIKHMDTSVIKNTELIAPVAGAKPQKIESLLSQLLKFACSVKVGVTLLVILGGACMIGMLVMQQNVDGFANYFAALTPAQRLVYGRLGFFDIYHSWYFNALLAALSLNIILSTIDRLPKIWPYFSRPSKTVPVRWLRDQSGSVSFEVKGDVDKLVNSVSRTLKENGFRRTSVVEKNGRTFVFGEKGAWNRLMFVAVHIALLMIFIGGFMTAQLGHTGNLGLSPGQSSDLMTDTAFQLDKVQEVTKKLPFEVAFTDIQQRLIRDDGSLSPANTIDWMTWFTIKDETGEHPGFVQMNRPFDYRGYRFFQASFVNVGKARNITLVATPANGGEPQTVKIDRNGSAELDNGTKLIFKDFRANFTMGPEDPNENSSNYQNPAAILEVLPREGVMQQATVFGPQVGDIPVAKKAVNGYTFKMTSFEKVADAHVLSVQRDPGSNVVYGGFALLSLTLVGVFAFSHRRVWASIDTRPGDSHELILAGNTNRNPNGFLENLKKLERSIVDSIKEKN